MENTLKKFMKEYKHLQQYYKTKKEFKQDLLSGEVKISIPDMIKFIDKTVKQSKEIEKEQGYSKEYVKSAKKIMRTINPKETIAQKLSSRLTVISKHNCDLLLEISRIEHQANTTEDFKFLEEKIKEFKSKFVLSEDEWKNGVDSNTEVEIESCEPFELGVEWEQVRQDEFAMEFAEWCILWRVESFYDTSEGILYTYGGIPQKYKMQELLEQFKIK